MHQIHLSFLIILVLILLVLVRDLQKVTASAAQAKSPIHMDAEAGVVTFTVNDRDAIRIDEAGLLVNGNISYRGTLTDGASEFHSTGEEGAGPR